jgi:hypothetical protein
MDAVVKDMLSKSEYFEAHKKMSNLQMPHPSTANLLPSYDDVLLPDVPAIIQTQNLTKKSMVVLSEYAKQQKVKKTTKERLKKTTTTSP